MAKVKHVRLTDLPEEEVDEFLKDYILDGYEFVQKIKQENGLWTLEVKKATASAGAPAARSAGSGTA